ncbi:MAG: ubiquitin-like domain-containing protein, partial [Oscillospiraceae bacterium]|nr:ubiquitin-like domain-containing protein [Oscillospiraceae bacterium]
MSIYKKRPANFIDAKGEPLLPQGPQKDEGEPGCLRRRAGEKIISAPPASEAAAAEMPAETRGKKASNLKTSGTRRAARPAESKSEATGPEAVSKPARAKKSAEAPPRKAAEKNSAYVRRLFAKDRLELPFEEAPPPERDEDEEALIAYFADALAGKSRFSAYCARFSPFLAAGLAALLCALLLFAPLVAVFAPRALCYIYEDGELKALALTNAEDNGEIFAEAGLELGFADEVNTEKLGSTAFMSVRRAHDISVRADGETIEHSVLGKTVGQALEELGIALGEDDRVSPSLDTLLENGDTVTVQRVRYEYRETSEEIPWQTVYKPSP